jgi:ribonuclease BN (tRNA processing enzyme)
MKLTFLGSGTAFCTMEENFHSNMVLESDTGKKLLIDCGTDIRHSTHALNLKAHDFDAVYISHLHGDHVGGLEWLGFSTKFSKNSQRPKLITHDSIRDELWENVLSGGMKTIKDENASLETYFELHPLLDETRFVWEANEFEMIKTIHTYDGDELRPSYGLFFNTGKNNVFITTDTQYTPDFLMSYYLRADVIFHDCETCIHDSQVHSNFKHLIKLPQDIKAKIWLYHYSANNQLNALTNGFHGFVKRGQAFEI